MERKQQQLAAELPDDSTGHQWTKASDEAKAALVERVGPSWTYMSHSGVIESVDTHYERAADETRSKLFDASYDDSVKDVIDQIVAREKKGRDGPDWKRQGFDSEAEKEEWVAQEAARRAGVPVDMMRGWNDISEQERQMRTAEELLRRQGID